MTDGSTKIEDSSARKNRNPDHPSWMAEAPPPILEELERLSALFGSELGMGATRATPGCGMTMSFPVYTRVQSCIVRWFVGTTIGILGT